MHGYETAIPRDYSLRHYVNIGKWYQLQLNASYSMPYVVGLINIICKHYHSPNPQGRYFLMWQVIAHNIEPFSTQPCDLALGVLDAKVTGILIAFMVNWIKCHMENLDVRMT